MTDGFTASAHHPHVGVDIGLGAVRVTGLGGDAPAKRYWHTPVAPGGPRRGTPDASPLRELLGPHLRGARTVAVAVPHAFLAPDTDAAPDGTVAETETLPYLATLRDLVGGAAPAGARVDLVPGPVAALAALAADGVIDTTGRNWTVVADLGVSHTELVLCEHTAHGPRARAWVGGPAADALWDLARIARPVGDHAARLLRARELLDVSARSLRYADEALRAAAAAEADGNDTAAKDGENDTAAMDGGDGAGDAVPPPPDFYLYSSEWLEAAAGHQVLAPLTDAVEALAGRLRRARPEETAAAPLLLLGVGARFGLMRDALLRGLGRAPEELPVGDGPDTPALGYDDPTRLHAAASGAALAAAGRITLTDTFRDRIALQVHRRAGDTLVEYLAHLPELPRDRAPVFAGGPGSGTDAQVEFRDSGGLRLWIGGADSTAFVPLPVDASAAAVPPGTYRVGWRAAEPSSPVLLLVDVDSGHTVECPLDRLAPSLRSPARPDGGR
ncbi:hypothetical protein AB0O01_35105 [Streptomyces sp. NPDC093252]|uniref:hypothetical protein n=1 Tax=Streptomyces sp. NPDC093252 TaxID=3154980 RepID=UPI00343EFBB9